MSILEEGANSSQREKAFTENSSAEAGQSNPKNFREIQVSAFNTLALWSDPTWTGIKRKSSIHLTAVSEWVHHQRIWMAVDKVTIEEIIGSVRGVIPKSKLASYGNFRYDLDLEEMYDILDEIDTEYTFIDECWRTGDQGQNPKPLTQAKKSLEANENNSKACLLKIGLPLKGEKRRYEMKVKSNNLKQDFSGFDGWILKCQTLLSIVRRVVSQEKFFDMWSDVLLKTCSKFLSVLKSNSSLLKAMEADVPLIADYRQLLSEPITMLEILSLPQPYLDDSLNLDVEQEDKLWLKISSPSIKKLWGPNENERFEKELYKNCSSSGFNSWLGTTNFLRRQRQKKLTETSKEDIEVSESEARDLIGSLFNIINDHDAVRIETTGGENKLGIRPTSKNYFPEAHGEWTKTLFPRSVNGQNEVNTSVTSNGLSYFQPQTDRQVFYKPIIPPVLQPATFPPPLHVPPPPLPNTLHYQLTQKLPFYLPPNNQPLQSYNYEKVHWTFPRNYMISSRPLANEAQQSLAMAPGFSLQPVAPTNLHVLQVNRYSQSVANPLFQTNISSIPQTKQRYGFQDNVLAKKTNQLHLTNFTSMDKTAAQKNENFIEEVIKNKILPNIGSRISTINKLSSQEHELYQYKSGYSLQSTVNTVKSIKNDFPRMLNTQICYPQYMMPDSTELKLLLERSSELKKVEETNVSTQQHKRAPLMMYNHQRSPIAEKLRKDLSSTFLYKEDILNTPHKNLAEKLKQNTVLRVNNQFQKDSKKYAITPKQPEDGINSNRVKFSRVSEQFYSGISSSQNNNIRNVFPQNQETISMFDNPDAKDKVGYSDNYQNLKINKMNDELMFNAKLKLTARKKNWTKRKVRCDQYKVMLLLGKNLKMHGGTLDTDSIHKWIWDYIKLHKRDSLIKERLETNKYSIILNNRNRKFIFKRCKSENRRILKKIQNISSSKSNVRKNEGYCMFSNFSHLKSTNNKTLKQKSDTFKNGGKSNKIYNQKAQNISFDQLFRMKCNAKYQNPNNCNEENKHLKVEFLNRMAENLFFNNEVTATRPIGFHSEKINGWTYFKIAIQMILKKASHILMNRKYDK